MRTPGNWVAWQLAPDSDPQERHIATTEDGEIEVCGRVENDHDARLLAASPQLAAMLQKVYDEINTMRNDDTFDIPCQHDASLVDVQERISKLLHVQSAFGGLTT
jgi:hypothetical protein